jgi:hypothetical protein
MKLLMHHYPRIIAMTILLMSVLFWSAGCSKSSSPNDDKPTGPAVVDQVKATVTSTGADLALKNGMTLSIPAGAVTTSTNVTLSQLSGDTLFTSSLQTTLKVEAAGSVSAGVLRIPLLSGQTPDRFGAVYMVPGSTQAIYLEGTPNTTNDTISVELGGVAGGLVKIGSSLEGVQNGTYVVERGSRYAYTMGPVLAWPYYEQVGGNCWAAAWLMFMKGYSPHLVHDEIYKILSWTGVNKENGVGWYEMGGIELKTEVVLGISIDQNVWANYNNFLDFVLKNIDAGKPLLTNVIDHQILIVGYKIRQTPDGEEISLVFHDSQNNDDRRPYCTWTSEQLASKWWDTGILRNGLNYFVTLVSSSTPPAERRLQTVHLLDIISVPGTLEDLPQGLAFDSSGKIQEAITWDHRTEGGLKFALNIGVSPGITGINLKNVAVWNTDRGQSAGVRVKTTLHKVENGVYREPPLVTDEKSRTLASSEAYYYNVSMQLRPLWDDLQVGDTMFALVTAVFNNDGLRTDDFDYVFKYQPIRIKSIDPTSGKVGDNVTIDGIGFGKQIGKVTFNGTEAEVTSWTNSLIVAKVPSSASSGDVVVKVGNHSSNGMAFSTGSMLDMLHKTKYPSINVMGVFTYNTWTGYALFPPSYNWDYELVWNDTAFSQSYVKPTEEMRETVSINGSVNPAGNVVKRLWSYVKQETLRDDGTVSQQIVSEIRITDLPLDITYDDPGEFIAIYALEKEQIAPKLQKIRFVRTDYNEQGAVIATDSLINVNWLNSNNEGLVQMWFHEKGF